jgi:hypothetical protein
MHINKHSKKIFRWVAGVAFLVLAGTVALTQYKKHISLRVDQQVAASVGDAGRPGKPNRWNDNDSVEVVGTPTGEDPWKEVQKLVDAYYLKTGMAYRGTIRVIDDNADTAKVLEVQPFEYTILNNDNYYYRLAHMEMVSKRNYLLAVDNESKTICISGKAVRHKNARPFDIRDFKKILEKGNAHALVTADGDEKILTIDNIPDPDIQGYRIYYSPKDYRIHKMLIGMMRLSPLEDEKEEQPEEDADAPDTSSAPQQDMTEGVNTWYYYLEVAYTQVQPLALTLKEFNPENKFIQVQHGHLSLTQGYKQYQLLNTIEP